MGKQSLTVTVQVEPIIAEKTFNDVPVMARADGWKTAPSTALVTLSGPAAVMRELTSDRISVQAHIPTPAPVGKPLIVAFDPEATSDGLEVVHQGGKGVKVIGIEPGQVELEQTR